MFCIYICILKSVSVKYHVKLLGDGTLDAVTSLVCLLVHSGGTMMRYRYNPQYTLV